MLKIDLETYEARMPPGDTGDLFFDIDWDIVGQKQIAVVFAIVNERGKDIFSKSADVNEDGMAHIRLCNHDTRDLKHGDYYWQLRVVTDPERDADGKIIASDCGDDVISVFDGDELPSFRLERRGAFV